MSAAYGLGTVKSLRLSARPSAFITFLLLWIALGVVGVVLLKLSPGAAILGALLAAVLHWLGEMVHQLGHAWAAQRTGYPMRGIEFWFAFSTSVYPPDEPELPAAIHIRRALGGPTTSFLLTLIAGALVVVLIPLGGVLWYVVIFFCLDNLLVFTLGAFLPLGFTDGSTLLYWRRKRASE